MSELPKRSPRIFEKNVKWPLLEEAINQVRAAFAYLPPDKMQDMIDEAVSEVRRKKPDPLAGS